MPMKYTEESFKRLPNKEAIATFEGKTLMTSWHYLDVLAQEHATAFTVAKMLDEDLLKDVKEAMEEAIKNGTSFNDFQKRIKGYLMAKGWHSETIKSKDPKTGEIKDVHLGSTRRLKIIYNTNKRTARASARWQRIQKTKDTFPYLQYRKSTSENKRLDHKRYYGLVLHVDHPFWQLIFPPNGYGCKCRTKQLTAKEAEKIGISDDFELEFEDFKNPRTGKTIQVPKGIEPSFAHNHDNNRLQNVLKLAREKHGVTFMENTEKQAVKIWRDLSNSLHKEQGIHILKEFEGKSLPPPKKWKLVSRMGKGFYYKHYDLFNGLDLTRSNAFANAMAELMKREGVETGTKLNVVGDHAKELQEIIKRYPATWVNEVNRNDSKCFLFNSKKYDDRGFCVTMKNPTMVDMFNNYIDIDIELESYKDFIKYKGQFREGDSLLYVNNLHVHSIFALDVCVHEVGHRFQDLMPNLNAYFKRFWLDRTKGYNTKPLAEIKNRFGKTLKYPPQEQGRQGGRNGFVHVYLGKNYGDDNNPQPDEVLTVTFETILGTNIQSDLTMNMLLKYEKDLLYLAIGLLLRFKP